MKNLKEEIIKMIGKADSIDTAIIIVANEDSSGRLMAGKGIDIAALLAKQMRECPELKMAIEIAQIALTGMENAPEA